MPEAKEEMAGIDTLEQLSALVGGGIPEEKRDQAGDEKPVVDKPAADDKKQDGIPGDLHADGDEVGAGSGDEAGADDADKDIPDEKTFEISDKKAQIAAYKAMREKIKSLSSKQQAPDAKELESLKARVTEYEGHIAVKELTASKAFQDSYVAPVRQLGEQFGQVAKEHGLSADDAIKALRADRTERVAIIQREATNAAAALAELLPLAQKFFDKNSDLQVAAKDAKATIERLRTEDASHSQAALAPAIDAQVKELAEKGKHFLLRDSKDNPAWLPSLKERAAKMLSVDASASDRAKVSLLAATSEHYRDLYLSQVSAVRKENEDLKRRLGGISSASPRVGAGGQGAGRKGSDSGAGATTLEALAEETVSAAIR